MTDNFVQQNYDRFGIWGEVYTRQDLNIMNAISVALWLIAAIILALFLVRIFKLRTELTFARIQAKNKLLSNKTI